MAVEGGKRIDHPANLQGHVGQNRNGVPPQAQILRGRKIGVGDDDFVGQKRSVFEDISGRQGLAVLDHDPGKGRPRRLGCVPALLEAIAGEVHAVGVAQHRSVGLGESGIPNQLVVGHAPGHILTALRLGKDGDDIGDLSPVEGGIDVAFQMGVSLFRRLTIPCVMHLERAPKVPSNASVGIPPSELCSELQLSLAVSVSTFLLNLRFNLSPAQCKVRYPSARHRVSGHGVQEGPGFFFQLRHAFHTRKRRDGVQVKGGGLCA